MSLWRDREFRRFWSGQAVSELGDRVTELALPLLAIVTLDATPGQVGVLTAAVWLPSLAGFVIGTWVDRRRFKRRLMIVADLSRTGILLSLPVVYWLGGITMTQLYVVALLAGLAKVVFDTAYASFFVRLVTRDQFMEANSKLSTTQSMSLIGGQALGGALVQALTAPIAVLVDAASFCFSALQLSRLHTPDVAPEASSESLLRQTRDGMRYLLRHRLLRADVGCSTTANFFNFIGLAVLILFASRNLELSAGTIGLAFGVGATGGLLGAVTANRLAARLGLGRLVSLAAIAFPGAVAIAALAGGPAWQRAALLGCAEFVGGFAVMCFDIPLNSLKATIIPDTMRSRVSGAFRTINYGSRPVGAVIGGLLGTTIGVRNTLLVSAAGGILALLWLIGSGLISVRDLSEIKTTGPAHRPRSAGSARVE